MHAAAGTIPVLSVSELTQNGNKPNDNVNQLHNVIDGKPGTEWRGDVYLGPHFGGSGGFGLVARLGRARTLHQLVVTTPMTDWSAKVFVSEAYAPKLSGWGKATDGGTGLNGDATFSLGGRRGGWVLFWMTDPGPSRQAVVQQLSVR